MARPSVPQFGNWEAGEDNVPYTLYFDKARKNKGGKIINPNDPRENPEMFANTAFAAPAPAPAPAPPSRHRAQQEDPLGRGANKPLPQQRESREESEFKQFSDSPARYRNGGRGAATTESPYHQYGGGHGTGSGRPSRKSTGSEHSIERSPLHPNHPARLAGRASGSPAWEGKRSSEPPQGTPGRTFDQGTPGRTRIKPKPRDEAPARDVIPQFGAWNVNDPQSADNYTYIFNQNAKGGNSRDTNSAPSPQHSSQNQITDDHVKVSWRCCFPWGKK